MHVGIVLNKKLSLFPYDTTHKLIKKPYENIPKNIYIYISKRKN